MEYWGLSDIGRVRAQNQDAFRIEELDRHTILAVVCDGMGGAQGGDQQIAARIACNEIDLLLLFRDPLTARKDEPNEANLLRLCDVHNVPLATNVATAEVLIHGLQRGDLDWRDIVNPKNAR